MSTIYEDYDRIWDYWIVPLINKVPLQMDPLFKSETQFHIRDLDEIKYLSREYFAKRTEAVKREFYGDNPTREPQLMDFHKLCAVLCRTLIEYKVYNFDLQKCQSYITKSTNVDRQNTDWLVCNALVNFRLSFLASVVLLYQSMLYRLYSSDSALYLKLKRQRKLDLYDNNMHLEIKDISCGEQALPRNIVHESFVNSMVLDLSKRDINNRSFDFFLFSTIMYQLEEYNLMLLVDSQ